MLVLSIREIVIVRTKVSSMCSYIGKSLYQKLDCYVTKIVILIGIRPMKYYILSPFTLENENEICRSI